MNSCRIYFLSKFTPWIYLLKLISFVNLLTFFLCFLKWFWKISLKFVRFSSNSRNAIFHNRSMIEYLWFYLWFPKFHSYTPHSFSFLPTLTCLFPFLHWLRSMSVCPSVFWLVPLWPPTKPRNSTFLPRRSSLFHTISTLHRHQTINNMLRFFFLFPSNRIVLFLKNIHFHCPIVLSTTYISLVRFPFLRDRGVEKNGAQRRADGKEHTAREDNYKQSRVKSRRAG